MFCCFSSRIRHTISYSVTEVQTCALPISNAVAFIQDFHADIAFLSGIGLSLSEGLMEPNPLEIEVKRAMVKNAAKVILLLESYKFGNSSAMSVVDYTDIDEIVTDANLDQEFIENIQKKGIKVHQVHE